MVSTSLFPYQYRAFDYTYSFTVKSNQELTIKIYDVSQKCIQKCKVKFEEQKVCQDCWTLNATNISLLLSDLIQKTRLAKEYILPSAKKDLQECLECMDRIIAQARREVLVQGNIPKTFECAITGSLLVDPVQDDHGHTFEKKAIEEWRAKNNACPLSREPITTLTPNRLLQQTIEEWQKQDPIPTLSLFKNNNPQIAVKHKEMAELHIQEKEYEEAIACYKNLFHYTNNWKDYALLPPLFQKMGDTKKATLAYLYLAQYQVNAGQLELAIQNIEQGKIIDPTLARVDFLLVKLYLFLGETEKALALTKKTFLVPAPENPSKQKSPVSLPAEDPSGKLAPLPEDKENPREIPKKPTQQHNEEAAHLFKTHLSQDPTHWEFYPALAALQDTPSKKVQILLKGASHALEAKNYQVAERLCKTAQTHETHFLDHLLELDLLDKQHRDPQIKQKLASLLDTYKDDDRLSLKLYKYLLLLENNPQFYGNIVTLYDRLGDPTKALDWHQKWLSVAIEKQQWPEAELIAEKVLARTENKIPLYHQLEIVYTNWQGHQLENLWGRLGSAYAEQGQLPEAEKTYRQSFEQFHSFDHIFALAQVLQKQNKVSESVKSYHEASTLALLDNQFEQLDLCVRQIRLIDPKMLSLDSVQKTQLVMQHTQLNMHKGMVELSQQVNQLETENGVLKAEVEKLKAAEGSRVEVKKLKLEKIQQEQQRFQELEKAKIEQRLQEIEQVRQVELQRTHYIQSVAFGKSRWEEYIGTVGAEPPLPADIDKILKSPCPFWPNKKVYETHLLTLIPQTVNGQPLTLKTLGELVQKPLHGSATKYSHFNLGEYKDPPAPASHWAILSRDVIPGSRNKSYADQQQLVNQYPNYKVPHILDATVALFMEHVQSGARLYSDELATYTRCQEKYNANWQLVVGGFAAGGLDVKYYDHVRYYLDREYYGVLGQRK